MFNQPKQSKQNNPTSKKVQPSTLAQPYVQTEPIKDLSDEELEQVAGGGIKTEAKKFGAWMHGQKYDPKTGTSTYKSQQRQQQAQLRQQQNQFIEQTRAEGITDPMGGM